MLPTCRLLDEKFSFSNFPGVLMDNALIAQAINEFYSLRPLDGLTIVTLAALEGILSVDNSLVLAIMVRSLPKHQQKRALTYGIVGAFVFRLIALVFASYLIRFMIFKLIGGAYLLYLAMKHMFFFYKEDAHQPGPRVTGSFWKTVAAVELTDIAFSIDSITTAIAMSDKILIVWLGGILGIVFLRFLAHFMIRLLEKMPKLEDLAYQLIFFIGAKLLLDGFNVHIDHSIFWLMMGVIVVLGCSLLYRDHYQRTTKSKFHDRLLDRLERGEITVQELLTLEYLPREVIEYLQRNNCLKIDLPGSGNACGGHEQAR
jgi:YkoY family integral membrane protein